MDDELMTMDSVAKGIFYMKGNFFFQMDSGSMRTDLIFRYCSFSETRY